MAENTQQKGRMFSVETHFQKMAQRPGGIPREKAIENAQSAIEQELPAFEDWLADQFGQLKELVAELQSGAPKPDWLRKAWSLSRQLRDTGTTMGNEMVTVVATTLTRVLEAAIDSGTINIDAIICHVDALALVRQPPYCFATPKDLPELIQGLEKVVGRVTTPAPTPGSGRR